MARYHNAAQDARRREVANLILQHYTETEIAERLGVARMTVIRDVAKLRAEWRAQRDIDTDAWVSADLQRLAVAERAIWPQVEAGKLFAIDRLLAIQERRARYLGLDKQPAPGANHLSFSVAYIGVDGEIVAPPPGTIDSYVTGDALQRGLLREAVGQDDPGD
jgi:hypothetical protein